MMSRPSTSIRSFSCIYKHSSRKRQVSMYTGSLCRETSYHPFCMFLSTFLTVDSSKGVIPVSSSKRMQPSAHESTFSVYHWRISTCGDEYRGVPTTESYDLQSKQTEESPKSEIFTKKGSCIRSTVSKNLHFIFGVSLSKLWRLGK